MIRVGIERLDKETRRFAEIMMDSAVTGALGGKTMAAAGSLSNARANLPPPRLTPSRKRNLIENKTLMLLDDIAATHNIISESAYERSGLQAVALIPPAFCPHPCVGIPRGPW